MSPAEGTSSVIRESEIPGANLVRRGKVRDLYDLDDKYLIVATDRLSAFDVVLNEGIQDKGRILTQLSLFWFDLLGIDNHLISAAVEDLPEECAPQADQLRDRFMIVEKLEIQPVECIVRGYLAGSGWAEYQEHGTVCKIPLPEDSSTPASCRSRSSRPRRRRRRGTMRTFRWRPWLKYWGRSAPMR